MVHPKAEKETKLKVKKRKYWGSTVKGDGTCRAGIVLKWTPIVGVQKRAPPTQKHRRR